MKVHKVLGAMIVVLLVALCICTSSSSVSAQSTSTSQQTDIKEDETNLDTQLYLIVGTNQPVTDDKLPALLDPVVKQLRSTLPFKNYRLAATLLNRVKNEGRLDLSWVGGPLATTTSFPTFSQFKVRQVRLARNSAGESIVQMTGFNFGARVPVQVGAVAAAGGIPATNYENTGLATDISIREDAPVIVGTLNVGSGDAIILVVSARRTNK